MTRRSIDHTRLRDALNNLDPDVNGGSCVYERGILVGVATTLGAFGYAWSGIVAILRDDMPKKLSTLDVIPPGWQRDILLGSDIMVNGRLVTEEDLPVEDDIVDDEEFLDEDSGDLDAMDEDYNFACGDDGDGMISSNW